MRSRRIAAGLLSSVIPFVLSPALAGQGDEIGARTSPDPVYYEDVIQPLLQSLCGSSGCHGAPGAGRLFLERPDFSGTFDLAATEKNLDTVLSFVTFREPKKSRLINKPLARRDGGLPHSGGGYELRETSEGFRLLSEWINGVEIENVPPIADAGDNRFAKRGESIILDGGGSRDRRGRELQFSWSVLSRPEGSAPLLKKSDSGSPVFRTGRDGAYTLGLVVDNGEQKSQPSTVTIQVDSLPILLLEAERTLENDGFLVFPDPSASAGETLLVDPQQGRAGRARYRLTIPEGGAYRMFARINAAEVDTGSLSFTLDDGPARELQSGPTGGYRFVPLVEKTDGQRRPMLPSAGGEIVAGSAEVRQGRLCLRGNAVRPALLSFGAAGRGSLATTLRFEDVGAERLRDAAAWLLFDYQDGANYRLAGFEPGRSRVLIGQKTDGRLVVLAERRLPLRPELEIPFRIDFTPEAAFVYLDDGEIVQAEFDAPGGAGEVALSASADTSFAPMELKLAAGEARRFDFGRDEQPAGFLARGDHQLTVVGAPNAPRLDQILLVRSDFDGSLGDGGRRMVRALYLDLLGRTPHGIELMMASGVDRNALARRLVGSLEFYETFYELELFYFLLLDNFRPRTPTLESIPARLFNAQIDVRDAIQEIVISQYFNARNPGNDTFVSVILEQLLEITVQDDVRLLEAGKKMYDGNKIRVFGELGDNQSDLVRIVLDRPDFTRVLLQRHYRRLVGAEPHAADLDRWAALLAEDGRTYSMIVLEWVASDAYAAAIAGRRPKTDFMWIRSLFVDLLERKPTFAEFRNFRNAMQALSDSSALRSVLAKVILDSGRVALPTRQQVDPTAFIDEQFRRLLGRAPSADEMKLFLDELGGPIGDPGILIHAIVSSVEYQRY